MRGDVAVEALQIGDAVLTADGGALPVTWLGHRRFSATGSNRAAILPYRVAAGAIAPGIPARDLVISPNHSLVFDGHLIPVKFLANGSTITQMDVDAVTYWHVELPRHAAILAEDAVSESYLDNGNRASFANGADHIRLHGDIDAGARGGHCLPVAKSGPVVQAVRARLKARAEQLGWSPVRIDPDLHLMADGRRIEARITGRSHRFVVPAGARDVALVSNTFCPYEQNPLSTDRRRLGVRLQGRVVVEAEGHATQRIALDELSGLHKVEVKDGLARAWSTGTLSLPPLASGYGSGCVITVGVCRGDVAVWKHRGTQRTPIAA